MYQALALRSNPQMGFKISYQLPKHHNLFKRDSTNFKKEDFILDLLDIDWNTTLQTNKNYPDFSFNQFYEKINCIIDNHLPLKKVSKKELKQQFKQWYQKINKSTG